MGLDEDGAVRAGGRTRLDAPRLYRAERAVRILRARGAARPVRAGIGRWLHAIRAETAERASAPALYGLVRHLATQSVQVSVMLPSLMVQLPPEQVTVAFAASPPLVTKLVIAFLSAA